MIRVAVVGVGNCASSLMQAVTMNETRCITPTINGLTVADIDVVCGFDVDSRKVHQTLAVAAAKNNAVMRASLSRFHGPVYLGPRLDGVAEHMCDEDGFLPHIDTVGVDVVEALREHDVDVVVNYLPVGSEQAARRYARSAALAGCAFVNCMPTFLSVDHEVQRMYETRGLAFIGDDVKSQLGATIVHRALAELFKMRNVKLSRTYQLNTGGNTDFRNMLERARLVSKKISKTQAVTSVAPPIAAEHLHIGPSDFVPWLGDTKMAFIRMEGEGCMGAPIEIELKLTVEDSPNSAGVVLDCIRHAHIATINMPMGGGGALRYASAAYMKSPPCMEMSDFNAMSAIEAIACGEMDDVVYQGGHADEL